MTYIKHSLMDNRMRPMRAYSLRDPELTHYVELFGVRANQAYRSTALVITIKHIVRSDDRAFSLTPRPRRVKFSLARVPAA